MDLEKIKIRVQRALDPIKPVSSSTQAPANMLFAAQRAEASRELPAYYLVYFLLVDLMGYRNIGKFEKIAWSVPIDFNGRGFVIEHRKFGLGIFAARIPEDEPDAAEIAKRITKAARIAEPYFDWVASEAAKKSHLNVVNQAGDLFEKYRYFADAYAAKSAEAERRKDERIRTQLSENSFSIETPAFGIRKEAKWLALATIDSFFSWTEHVFILIAVLQQRITTGEEVSALAVADWDVKFKAVLDLADIDCKRLYDDLRLVRTQLRNVVAHGAFGKQGEALQFHSGAGAVPMLLPHRARGSFKFGRGIDFVDHEAIELLERFVAYLWTGDRAPAFIYIQDYDLPLIMTMTKDGQYAAAMTSVDEMKKFCNHLAGLMDLHANMDF